MFCPECGEEIPRIAESCPSCGADLRLHMSNEERVNLHNNLIDDKIALLDEEIQNTRPTGPGLLFISGVIVLVCGLLYYLPAVIAGSILIGCAFVWRDRQVHTVKRLQAEIRKLEDTLIHPGYD